MNHSFRVVEGLRGNGMQLGMPQAGDTGGAQLLPRLPKDWLNS
jgi:hypothetical protein